MEFGASIATATANRINDQKLSKVLCLTTVTSLDLDNGSLTFPFPFPPPPHPVILTHSLPSVHYLSESESPEF